MALPTPTELQTLDYGFNGEPFCGVPAKGAIDVKTMDYGFDGEPFVVNYGGEVPPPAYTPRVIFIS